MITSQEIVTALGENLEEIQNKLGLDWPRFCNELVSVRRDFVGIGDRNALERAADSVWKVCLDYSFVKGLVREYSVQRDRKLPPGQFRSEKMSVGEIVNCFQSLFDKLEEIEQLEMKNQPSSGTSQSGTKDPNDRRTYP